MSQFDTNYDKEFTPYRSFGPSGSGSGDIGLMLMQFLSGAVHGGPGGGTFNSPFNNMRDQSSAMAKDKVYQDMLANASDRYRTQVQSFLETGIFSASQAAGQPVTPEQQRAVGWLAQQGLHAGFASLSASAAGRRLIDVTTGGNNVLNTSLGYAQNYKELFDPLTGMPGLRADNMAAIAQSTHNYLFGGGGAMNNYRASGFNAADTLPVMNYLSRQGAFIDTALESRLLNDPTILSGLQSGMITPEDLERMGVGDLSQMINPDSDPGAAEAMNESIGRRGGRVMEDTMAAARAVGEIFGPELIDNMDEMLGRLQEFTQRYNRQISGRVQAGLLREVKHTFQAMGHSYDDLLAIQDYTAQNLAQMGYRGGATPFVMAETGAIMRGLDTSGSFSNTAYGARDIGEMTQQTIKDMGQYGKSRRASMLATIVGVAEDNNMQFTDDEAGQKAEKLVRNLMEGAGLGDLEGLTADELAVVAAQGMVGSDNYARILEESQNELLAETRGKKHRIDARMQEDRQADFLRVSRDYLGVQSFGTLADTSDPNSSAFLASLGAAMGEGAMAMTDAVAADEEMRKKYMGEQLLKTLQDQVASGDPILAAQAQRALDQLGSTPEEQQANAMTFGARYLNDVMAARQEPLLDTLRQFGDASIANANAQGNEAKVKSFVDEMMANTTNRNPMDAIKGLTGYLMSRGDEDVTAEDLEGAINATFKTAADPEIRKQITESIKRVQEIQASLAEVEGADPLDEDINQYREQQRAALEKETQFLQQAIDRGGYEEPKTPEEEAAAAGGPGGGKSAQPGTVVLNNPTFVIGDEFMLQINKQLSSKTLPNSTGNV